MPEEALRLLERELRTTLREEGYATMVAYTEYKRVLAEISRVARIRQERILARIAEAKRSLDPFTGVETREETPMTIRSTTLTSSERGLSTPGDDR